MALQIAELYSVVVELRERIAILEEQLIWEASDDERSRRPAG